MKKHFILPSLTSSLLIPVMLACSTHEQEAPRQYENPISVQVATATRQSTQSIIVSGQIESNESAVISTRHMGIISGILVKPGDRIRKGQLLVSIIADDIQAKRAQALAMISETEAALQDAEKDFKRYEELYQQQSASTKEFENAKLRYESVKAKTEAAHQMKNEADAMLAYTQLTAPFDGVITQKHNNEGSMANPGMPILTMEQNNSYTVRAFVSESEVSKIKTGMSVNVTIKSSDKQIAGLVDEISPSSQFTGGQYQIKVKLATTNSSDLYSGMYVNVNIKLSDNTEASGLMIPASAIVEHDQLIGLYTINENKTAQLRWLKVGKRQGNEVEVLSGLQPEEIFITQSDGRLFSGALVKVSYNNRKN